MPCIYLSSIALLLAAAGCTPTSINANLPLAGTERAAPVASPAATPARPAALSTTPTAAPVALAPALSDWPQFRGPTGQGTSTDRGVPVEWSPTEGIAWKRELPGPGTSTPIIFGDRIYLTYYTGYRGQGRGEQAELRLHLVAMKRDGGETIWTKTIEPKLPEQERIRDDHGYTSSSPAVDAERIVCFFGRTGVIAFDHSGQELWRADVGGGIHGWGSAASPVIFGDLVYINAAVESGSLVALNKKTGVEVWRARGINESWNTPILVPAAGGKTELVVAILGKVLGFDPAKGDKLWQCDTDIGWYMVPSLVADQGVVYAIGGRTGGGLAVRTAGRGDVTDSHRTWTIKKGTNVPSPILHEGHLYWLHENNAVAYCAKADTGEIVYEERVPGGQQVYASTVLAEGKLYYLSRQGRTFVVAAKPSFELLASNDLEPRGTFNSSPAIAGGKIYIRSDKFLYCIGKP